MSFKPAGITGGTTTREKQMWIEAEGPHKRHVNTFAFDTLYVSYKGSGKYAVCATVGSNDIIIKTCDTESAANAELLSVLNKIKADKP